MRYQRYHTYKDSGVAWLGQVPAHWGVVKIKRIFAERVEKSENGTETLLSVSAYTGVTPRTEIIESDESLTRAESLEGYKLTYTNDLVINIMLAWNRGLGISKYYGIVSPAYCVFEIISNLGLPEYLHFLLRTDMMTIYFKAFSTGVIDSRLRLYPDVFLRLSIPLPPLAEQQVIAAFLDRECAQIDTLVAAQQRLIALLKEKRQALIAHTVTQGLDPAAPCKDSGVAWLGQVPAHWEVKKTKYLCKISTGDKDTINASEDGLYPFYVRSEIIERINSFTFNCEAILTAGDGAGVGKVYHHHVSGPFDFHQRVYMMNDFNSVTGRFFYYYFSSNFYMVALEGGAKSTVDSLRRPMITNFELCVPPLAEQQAIAAFLDRECAQIDTLVAKAEQAITLLHERRSALIAAAVTGQIRVDGEELRMNN